MESLAGPEPEAQVPEAPDPEEQDPSNISLFAADLGVLGPQIS